MIQIREKSAASDELYLAVAQCLDSAAGSGTKIIVNDRVDIAMAAGADGVHLGQTDLPAKEARKLLGDDRIIGISTHNLVQVREAAKMPVSYVAFGPVWPTGTKEDPDPVVGLDLLREAKTLVRGVPLVAIGGITEENIQTTLAAGADSVAVISELYRSDLPLPVRYRTLAESAAVKQV